MILNYTILTDLLVRKIRKYHQEAGLMRATIGISGGVDSAVALGLHAHALGAENITAVYMGADSSQDSLARAREVCEVFGVKLIEMDITPIKSILVDFGIVDVTKAGVCTKEEIKARIAADPTILGSVRSTLRSPTLLMVNRLTGNGLIVGTGNRDEDDLIRFFQFGGDSVVSTAFLSEFSKANVFQMGIFLGVPKSILNAKPSPDLWGNGEEHSDETEILSFLRLTKEDVGGLLVYSYVDDQGRYKNLGILERASNALDLPISTSTSSNEGNNLKVRDVLFNPNATPQEALRKAYLDYICTSKFFRDVPYPVAMKIMEAVIRAERVTRFKANPTLPTVTRDELKAAGAVRDALPSDVV